LDEKSKFENKNLNELEVFDQQTINQSNLILLIYFFSESGFSEPVFWFDSFEFDSFWFDLAL